MVAAGSEWGVYGVVSTLGCPFGPPRGTGPVKWVMTRPWGAVKRHPAPSPTQRRSKAVADDKAVPVRSHGTLGRPGYDEVADDVLAWALERASAYSPA